MNTITLNELSNYNAGRLVFQEFDLDELNTKESYEEAVSEWLESLPACDGCPCEEYNVADAEGLVRSFVWDYGIESAYWDYAAIELPEEVVMAGIACGIDADKMEEAYEGEYTSDESFAQELAESTGFEYSDNWPANCIDWEKAARELMYDYVEDNGYYFLRM